MQTLYSNLSKCAQCSSSLYFQEFTISNHSPYYMHIHFICSNVQILNIIYQQCKCFGRQITHLCSQGKKDKTIPILLPIKRSLFIYLFKISLSRVTLIGINV